MKQIHWETIKDVAGTIWDDKKGMRNDHRVLKELFPDLKDVFTSQKTPSGGGGDGDGAEAKEAAKTPKVVKISFISDAKAKKALGISVNSFKKVRCTCS